MNKEQTGITKKPSGRQWGVIGAVLLILIALIVGLSIYNTPANRLSRQVN